MQADAQQVIRRLAAKVGDLTAELTIAQCAADELAQRVAELEALQGPGGD